jgi:FkbM family methyltransferase
VTYSLSLSSIAAYYDLSQEKERTRSNQELVNFYCALIESVKPNACIEIGAFNAAFSVRMAKLGYPCYAFEANPYNYKEFREQLNISNLTYLNKAVSGNNGHITFHIQSEIDGIKQSPIRGNNSLMIRNNDRTTYEEVSVISTTMQSFIGEASLSDKSISLWVDVEGATSSIFAEPNHWLSTVSTILIEVEDIPAWKGQWLSPEVVQFLDEKGFIPIARDFEYKKQYNIVFINRRFINDSNVIDALANFHSKASQCW